MMTEYKDRLTEARDRILDILREYDVSIYNDPYLALFISDKRGEYERRVYLPSND